jgi:1,4-dihydroxy-2-naphthoate octaprenyltransferase
MKPELPPAVLAPPPRGFFVWWAAIRPRTLSISVTPVAVGSALAMAEGAAIAWLPMLAALLCALLIQIGTNLHNDAVDFERGTDGPDRLGPLRVTAAGWASAATVRRAAGYCFGLAVFPGLYLVWIGGLPIMLIGLASLLSGWAYSGGPRPISHSPLGELFVLFFFGIAAVGGSYWLQVGDVSITALLAGLVVGFPAAAVLLVNNYRDLDSDIRSGRRTLAAGLGVAKTRQIYSVLMLMPFALILWLGVVMSTGALLGLLALPGVWRLVAGMHRCSRGPELNPLLAATARAGMTIGLLFAVGLSLIG